MKDPETVWKSAQVTKDFDGTTLHLEFEDDAKSLELTIGDKKGQVELPPLRNPDILIGENDLTSLSYLHEVRIHPSVLLEFAIFPLFDIKV